uniref:Uncharacterized protein n=4 Tax=Oryza TaxID=4527 RepID=Q8H4H0_ORYSJ|nr:hypothetical protein [Oryza sativa Japonica Group]
MAAARVLCKRLTPLFLAAHASSSSVTCAGAAAAARTGMALMKNNPMKPPFSDSINGAKRPFSSTSTKNTDPLELTQVCISVVFDGYHWVHILCRWPMLWHPLGNLGLFFFPIIVVDK